jgi:hypothetical protein
MKFKVFQIRFVFYLEIIFIYNFVKMASVLVCLALDFSKEQAFPESNLITPDLVGKK